MHEERQFRVLRNSNRNHSLTTFPFRFIAPFEAQAYRNHSQTLARLNERGGCCPVEIWAIVTGHGWAYWRANNSPVKTDDEAEVWLKTWVDNQKAIVR